MARRQRTRARNTLRALLGFAAWGAIGAGGALLWFRTGWGDATAATDDPAAGLALLAAGAVVLLYLLVTHRRPASSSGGGARRLAIDHETVGDELVPCPACGKSIDVRRAQCIHCGAAVG